MARAELPDFNYSIATLGLNVLPAPPRPVAIASLQRPTSFCSVTERNIYYNTTYTPAFRAAEANYQRALRHLAAINVLKEEYDRTGSVFSARLIEAFLAYEPEAERLRQEYAAIQGLAHGLLSATVTHTCQERPNAPGATVGR